MKHIMTKYCMSDLYYAKGAFTNDVIKNSGFSDPLPPPSSSVIFAIPPLDDVIFYQPPLFPKIIFGKKKIMVKFINYKIRI